MQAYMHSMDAVAKAKQEVWVTGTTKNRGSNREIDINKNNIWMFLIFNNHEAMLRQSNKLVMSYLYQNNSVTR